MAVTINLNTLLAGSLNYFSGMTAERHSPLNPVTPMPGGLDLIRMDQHRISQNGPAATLTFARVPAGVHHFCVRGSDGLPRWRSPALQVTSGNEQFSFNIVGVDPADTTFKAKALTDGFSVPQTFDLDGLDEDLRITSLDLDIFRTHLDVDGQGMISKGDDWSPLKSSISFDYDFNLTPTKSIPADRFIRVEKAADINLQLSNPLTSIGAFFMRDTIEKMIARSINNAVNEAIEAQLRRHTSNIPRSLRNQVTATIGSITILRVGNEPSRSLRVLIDVSIPSAAFTP
jgi:hypothetical protein